MRALGVVMPLYQAERHLDSILPPLVSAVERGAVTEVVVVDDSSSDGGVERCRAAGFRVLASGGRLGPGACRNQGAQALRTDLVLFLDSDVVMHDDVPERVLQAFAEEPGLAAVFGSYDDRPAAPGLVSRYRNLLHHYVHHNRGRSEASTFWAGCGAIDRAAFMAVGGFDAARYPRPSIEDIELGYRLRRAGHRIRLDPAIQCTHLKRWTFANMLETDVRMRALPWGRLLLEPGSAAVADLNLTAGEKARAALAGLTALSLAGGIVDARMIGAGGGLLLAATAASLPFYRLVQRRFGTLHMLAAVLLHQLYYLYSSAAWAWCRLETLWRRPRA